MSELSDKDQEKLEATMLMFDQLNEDIKEMLRELGAEHESLDRLLMAAKVMSDRYSGMGDEELFVAALTAVSLLGWAGGAHAGLCSLSAAQVDMLLQVDMLFIAMRKSFDGGVEDGIALRLNDHAKTVADNALADLLRKQ